jgi:hypothetical protein
VQKAKRLAIFAGCMAAGHFQPAFTDRYCHITEYTGRMHILFTPADDYCFISRHSHAYATLCRQRVAISARCLSIFAFLLRLLIYQRHFQMPHLLFTLTMPSLAEYAFAASVFASLIFAAADYFR